LQVVVNPLLLNDSPIHDKAWSSLKELNADNVRIAFKYPYPYISVSELYPPSGELLCGSTYDSNQQTLHCDNSGVINEIVYASYGTNNGECGNFSDNSACVSNQIDYVKKQCLNQQSCTIDVNATTFGNDPCPNTFKRFDVE